MSARITEWRGDAILTRVLEAARKAVDDTTEAAARDAAGNHWWSGRSGQLEGEIGSKPAERNGDVVDGSFGATKTRGFYGLFLERRTPFLRPAADREFPRLAGRIRARL